METPYIHQIDIVDLTLDEMYAVTKTYQQYMTLTWNLEDKRGFYGVRLINVPTFVLNGIHEAIVGVDESKETNEPGDV